MYRTRLDKKEFSASRVFSTSRGNFELFFLWEKIAEIEEKIDTRVGLVVEVKSIENFLDAGSRLRLYEG